MNTKKILIAILFLIILALGFFGGYKYNQLKSDNSYTKAIKPADDLVTFAISDNPDDTELKKIYEDTHQAYKDSSTLEQYKDSIKAIKNSNISETDAYIGSSDNIVTYGVESKVDNKKYKIYIGTTKDNEKDWKISSIIVTEL